MPSHDRQIIENNIEMFLLLKKRQKRNVMIQQIPVKMYC